MNKWMAFACLAAPGLVAAAQVDVKFSGHVSYLGLVTCSAYTDGTCQGQVAQTPTELEFMDGVIRWGDSCRGLPGEC